ncbi:MAG: hypothetical protein M0R30_00240 [Methanoregula sp.]|jgi:hypothetical protein|uniref:hypothetical protein n=1 Tax=Methanoregula sp. TaxID=2052170 RepID=UPI0025CFEC8D|nr:hypothetical protein [Methanoregula sp.]MCK9630048.1 hypothetical protein [Methanoregula sp.]
MTVYNDLYIRDNFGDTGTIPSSGNPWQSPDIIPYQNEMLTGNHAKETYAGPDIGRSIINSGINNIYVRSKNLNTSAGSGRVDLYYADASLFLLPKTWTPVSTAGGKIPEFVDSSGNTSIAPGEIGLSNPAFLLTGMPAGPHYCFIAVAQTTAHPVTIPPSFVSNAAYSLWVQENPAVGWRNISYSPNTLVQMSRVFHFGNVNPASAYFYFRIVGRGFVPGTKINSQCTDRSCPINVDTPLPEPDDQGNQIAGFQTSVPAGFWGDLVLTATSPTGKFPVGATLTMSYYQIPAQSDRLEMAAAKRFIIASGKEDTPLLTTAMLIKIGECTIAVTDDPKKAEG